MTTTIDLDEDTPGLLDMEVSRRKLMLALHKNIRKDRWSLLVMTLCMLAVTAIATQHFTLVCALWAATFGVALWEIRLKKATEEELLIIALTPRLGKAGATILAQDQGEQLQDGDLREIKFQVAEGELVNVLVRWDGDYWVLTAEARRLIASTQKTLELFKGADAARARVSGYTPEQWAELEARGREKIKKPCLTPEEVEELAEIRSRGAEDYRALCPADFTRIAMLIQKNADGSYPQ